MAINMPTLAPQAQEESTLDKIAQGLNIINSTLGIALAVPKYMQDKKASEASIKSSQLKDLQTVSDIARDTTPAASDEPGSFEVPGLGFRKPSPSLEMQLKQQKILEGAPLAENKALFEFVKKNAPSIADIPGITIGDARDSILKSSQTDPRLELMLKNYDLALKGFTNSQVKAERQDFSSRMSGIKDRINKIKDPELSTLALADRAQDFIKSGSTIGANTAAAVIAKSVGRDTGALTESDIARYLPKNLQSKGIEVFNFLTGKTEAPLSPDAKAALNNIVTAATKSIRKNLAFQIVDELEQSGAGDPDFFNRQEMRDYIKTLKRQIKGTDTAKLIRDLEDQLDSNPGRAEEIRKRIDSLSELF